MVKIETTLEIPNPSDAQVLIYPHRNWKTHQPELISVDGYPIYNGLYWIIMDYSHYTNVL